MPRRSVWLAVLVALLLGPIPVQAASGDRVESRSFTSFFQTTWVMLDNEAGAADGVWVDYRG